MTVINYIAIVYFILGVLIGAYALFCLCEGDREEPNFATMILVCAIVTAWPVFIIRAWWSA